MHCLNRCTKERGAPRAAFSSWLSRALVLRVYESLCPASDWVIWGRQMFLFWPDPHTENHDLRALSNIQPDLIYSIIIQGLIWCMEIQVPATVLPYSLYAMILWFFIFFFF